MPPKGSQKRAPKDQGAQSKKRTRFASPGEDAGTFADQVDATLETPVAIRKGHVTGEGYESDSSDDGEGVVESRKKKEGADGEDDDMFAMDENSEAASAAPGKKKEEKFLSLGDIEGQEFGQAGDGADSEDLEDEPEDEDEAVRRSKRGMGYELSGFNMREEMEEGQFAEDGTFVRAVDPHAMHDRWMEGVSERDMKKARKSQKMRERQEKERIQREEDSMLSKEDAEKELLGYLRKGESVVEALQRLAVASKRLQKKHPKPKKSANNVDITEATPLPPDPIQEAVTRITDLASSLMSRGNVDIYSTMYEQLLRSIRSAGDVDPDWTPEGPQYEYRWADETRSQEVFGPYKLEDMNAWMEAKYFGDEGESVRVRRVGENDWHDWDEVIY